jgi:hypothetical protein
MKFSFFLFCLLTVSFASALFERKLKYENLYDFHWRFLTKFWFTAVNEIEAECISCTTLGSTFRYFKCLYPISPKEYFCANNTRTIPFGSIILEVVYKPSSCQDITLRLPSRNISDINDLSGSFSVDDIFIILGNTTGWSRPSISHDSWIFIPCIGKKYAIRSTMKNENNLWIFIFSTPNFGVGDAEWNG